VVSHLFSFHLLPGEDSQFEEYFSNGLKPPASRECYLILVIFLPHFSWLRPLCTHLSHMCHKDIAWSDLLTEAVYSTHLREKPDQGPSCLECNQFLWWNFSRQNDRFFLGQTWGGWRCGSRLHEAVDRWPAEVPTQLNLEVSARVRKINLQVFSCSSQQVDMKCFCFLFWYLFAHTVDRRNAAPSGMKKTLQIMG